MHFLGHTALAYHFSVPHDLTLAEDKNLIYVADRENGRIQCFRTTNGTFVYQIQSNDIGFKIYGVSYTPVNGMCNLLFLKIILLKEQLFFCLSFYRWFIIHC